ncbi:MAG: hypothetical protein OXH90_03470 [Paracoccaceae bacterium]|nr:hypothetical protein [Paracoccaceae bacterium]MDE2916890.1 hypothetical protein [Paracoccaceae bacterium]
MYQPKLVPISPPTDRIYTEVDSSINEDIVINESGRTITSREYLPPGIFPFHHGKGTIDIDFSGESITTNGARSHGTYGIHQSTGNNDVVVVDIKTGEVTNIKASSNKAHGIHAGGTINTIHIFDRLLEGSLIDDLGGTTLNILDQFSDQKTLRKYRNRSAEADILEVLCGLFREQLLVGKQSRKEACV